MQGYSLFYPLSILSFSQSNSRTHLCHVRIPVLQHGKLFGSHVLLNKRQLTVSDQEVQGVKPEGKNRHRNTPSDKDHFKLYPVLKWKPMKFFSVKG